MLTLAVWTMEQTMQARVRPVRLAMIDGRRKWVRLGG